MTKFTGSCLCGNVSFEGDDPQGGGHCYCNDCRRASGTSHCSHMIAQESAFSISGEMRFFDSPADSGNIVRRGFCPTWSHPDSGLTTFPEMPPPADMPDSVRD